MTIFVFRYFQNIASPISIIPESGNKMQMKMNECCDIKVTSFEESNIVDKLEFLFFLTFHHIPV